MEKPNKPMNSNNLPPVPVLRFGNRASFDEMMAAQDNYGAALEAFDRAYPLNRAICWKTQNGVSCITPNIGGGWRSTHFSHPFRDSSLVSPWGHAVYKTRLEAIRQEGVSGELLDPDQFPQVLSEAERKILMRQGNDS